MPRGEDFAPLTGAFGRLFCFLLALSVPAFAVADSACALDWETRQAHVRHVIDGDTLLLENGDRVRLVGADTPELGRDGRADAPFAVEAREHLDMLVNLNQHRVTLASGPEPRDRYGRLLAIVIGERQGDFTAHLLRNGLALAVAVPPNTAAFACHLAAEKEARAARRGLWSSDPVIVAAALGRTGYTIVRGRAGNWRTRRNDHFLELDGAVTLRVRGADLEEWFVDSPLANYAGRMLEVRGWVHPWSRGRFAITVQHPVTIEILDDTADDL